MKLPHRVDRMTYLDFSVYDPVTRSDDEDNGGVRVANPLATPRASMTEGEDGARHSWTADSYDWFPARGGTRRTA